jgi:shikimate kinase
LKIARIVLVGFMGAGKSTVGPLLAARLGFQFVDADQRLEQEAGLSVAEIFETQGEPAFRRMEAETIRQLLQLPNLVLALGGGALETQSTRTLLRAAFETCVIFLEAPLNTLLARCEQSSPASNPPVRPIFAELRKDPARLEEKLSSRLEHYRTAHLTIATIDLTPGQVVDTIVDRLLLTAPGASAAEARHAEGIW